MCDGQDASVPISLQPSRQGGWVLPWVLECTWKLTVLVEVHDLNMRTEQDVVAGVLQQHVSEPLCVCVLVLVLCMPLQPIWFNHKFKGCARC